MKDIDQWDERKIYSSPFSSSWDPKETLAVLTSVNSKEKRWKAKGNKLNDSTMNT